MIRKSTFDLGFANTGKAQELLRILEEGRRVINVYIGVLWAQEKFTGRFFNAKTETWLSARLQQACGKQALEIVKSQRKRRKKTRPVLKKLSLQLDSRFVSFLHVENSFDFWARIGSVGDGIHVTVPARKHRHFNGLCQDGWKLKSSTRLGLRGDRLVLDVYLEKEAPPAKTTGKTVGIDIGYRKLIATSEGEFHGDRFKDLAEKIQRKRPGSKNFKRALIERDEYVNRTVKTVRLEEARTLVLEALHGLKNGRRFRRKFQARFQRWTYPSLIQRLKFASERLGVQVVEMNPAFTSQTCSRCGHKDNASRNGEVFACTGCGWVGDADLNASVNISMRFRLREDMDPEKSKVPV